MAENSNVGQKILDLAIHGKLVSQDPNDEPASILLERIRVEKEKLIEAGKIKKTRMIQPLSEVINRTMGSCRRGGSGADLTILVLRILD